MRFPKLLALLGVAAIQTAAAQDRPVVGATLTLDEAIVTARRNNPAYLQTVNNRRTADAQVRQAYGSLLPSSSASFSTRYQQGGQQFVQGVALSSSSDALQSSYGLNLGYTVNGSSLLNPTAARANRDATEADISGSSEVLRSTVTQQYITALQAEARANLQDTLGLTTRAQLELAQTRMQVGAGNILDVRRAEGAVGQSEVASLTAHNTARLEKLRLFQTMGVAATDADVQLVTRFTVTPPTFTRDSLLGLARRVNPQLEALRYGERASDVNLKVARSTYLPTLSLGTGWGGTAFEYTDPEFVVTQAQLNAVSSRRSCLTQDSLRTRVGLPALDCNRFELTDAQAAAIRSSNDRFPFKFNRSPMGVSATLSLPVFDGFSRELRVEQAEVARDNARYQVRARELELITTVSGNYMNLMTALRTVELQEQNAARAREELTFAEERYRVGAATFLEVTTSRGNFEQAQIDRLNAIYDFHKAFAALEAAVGRPLR